MIPDRYTPTIKSMNYKIYRPLRYNKDRFSPEGQKILDVTSCRYSTLYCMARLFHPFLVGDPTRLSPDLSCQKMSESFNSWVRKANFHCAMQALPNDVPFDLGTESTLNSYINLLHNHDAIMDIAKRERASPNENDQENYTKGVFLTHLRALHDECERISASSQLSSFSR